MFKILLFDLDGTLLEVDMRVFIREYFRELGDYLKVLVPPPVLQKNLNYATRAMIENQDPRFTNQEVFWETFLEGVEKPREVMEKKIYDFYRHRFQNLKAYTRVHPRARRVLERVMELDCQMVIATNPVFPYTAIWQRMEWGQVEDFPYRLITSYEKMHFCKPHPGYYREILEMVGASSQECLMIGNDPADDLPASRVGIKTFLVEDFLVKRGNLDYQADYRGKLEELPSLLDRVCQR